MSENFFFWTGFSTLLVHEMDAVRLKEWRILPLLSRLDDRRGFAVFTLVHVPIYKSAVCGPFIRNCCWWEGQSDAQARLVYGYLCGSAFSVTKPSAQRVQNRFLVADYRRGGFSRGNRRYYLLRCIAVNLRLFKMDESSFL